MRNIFIKPLLALTIAGITGCASTTPPVSKVYTFDDPNNLRRYIASITDEDQAVRAWLDNVEVQFTQNERAHGLYLGYILEKITSRGALISADFPIDGLIYYPNNVKTQSVGQLLNSVADQLNLSYTTAAVEPTSVEGEHQSSPMSKNREAVAISITKRDGLLNQTPVAKSHPSKLEVFPMYRAEKLADMLERLARVKGYARGIVDFDSNTISPEGYKNTFQGAITGYGLNNLFNQIEAQLEDDLGKVDFKEGYSSRGTVLILTNKDYSDSGNLKVFTVTDTTLRKNAQRLADYIGYELIKGDYGVDAWGLDVDYPIIAPYDVVVSDPMQAFSELFAPYPVKAKLVRSSKKVFFVERMAPISKEGLK